MSASASSSPTKDTGIASIPNPAGMPPLDMGDKHLSFFEFWPGWKFYWPIAIAMAFFIIRFRGFTLPTVTNPGFSFGGFCGESKGQILDHGRHTLGNLIAPFILFRRTRADAVFEAQMVMEALYKSGLDFPVVAKPDKGCRGAGVQPLYTIDHLKNYLKLYPVDQDIIFQKMVNSEGEAGIFYIREPGQAKGRIVSVTLKYFPYVIGDGQSTLEQLIDQSPRCYALRHIYRPRFTDRLQSVPPKGEKIRLAFAGNHSKGTIFRNGMDTITPLMEDMFDRLSQSISGFYMGRYDIRFDDYRRLQAGYPEFSIIEINGSGGEMTHIWDSRTTLLQAWRDVIYQFYMVWKIGAAMRKQGVKPTSIIDLWRAYRNEINLTKLYPPTL